jgi:plastocyanin
MWFSIYPADKRYASAERAVRCRPTSADGDFDAAIPPKKTVTYVLKKAGTVAYYCRFHPSMKAVLNVAP